MQLGLLLELAERQHHVLLRSQLRGVGMSRKTIAARQATGWLREVLPGAFCLGTETPTEWQRAVAAGLAGGAGSALSHGTAARIHRLPHLAPDSTIHLTLPNTRNPRVPGVVVHRVAGLPAEEVEVHRGVAVTTAARTLVDLAPDLTVGLIGKIVDEGLVGCLWDHASLEASVERAAGRPGVGKLRQVMSLRGDRPRLDSVLEARVERALVGLHPFSIHYQVVIDGHVIVVDFAWPRLKVAAECDGWTVRSRSRGKFDHDRRRDNLLAAHGWSVAHLTSAMSDEEMVNTVVRLLLSSAASSGSSGLPC